MKFLPIDSPALIDAVAGWLGKKENYQWLDFGQGVQQVSALTLKIMTQRDIHVLRVFTADDDATPIGVTGLSNVDRRFRTATAWTVLGSKRFGGTATRATVGMLTVGFKEVGLHAINAWTVETNIAAQRVLERVGFRYIGRLRQCHYMDGRPLDRLLYDIMADELCEPNDVR
jgi:RimJ/RimL family protein N-acetyltransferase